MNKLANEPVFGGKDVAGSSGGITAPKPNSGIGGTGGGSSGLWGHLTSSVPSFEIPNMPGHITSTDILRHGLPNNTGDAVNSYNATKNKNYTPFSADYHNHATNAYNYMDKNKNHPIVQKMMSDPNVSSNMQLFNSPVGQIARTVGPAIGNYTKDPERFANLARIPGISNVFQGVMGTAGMPGLALAHSYLSGNMGNWNDLTAGISDPNSRMPGRNFNNEASSLMKKPASHQRIDVIDAHMAKMANYQTRRMHHAKYRTTQKAT